MVFGYIDNEAGFYRMVFASTSDLVGQQVSDFGCCGAASRGAAGKVRVFGEGEDFVLQDKTGVNRGYWSSNKQLGVVLEPIAACVEVF